MLNYRTIFNKYKKIILISSVSAITVVLLITSFFINRFNFDLRNRAASSALPIGSLTTINPTTIAGNAYDPDRPDLPITLHIYIDDTLFDVAITKADRTFNYIHDSLGAGLHKIVVYGIGINSSGVIDGDNNALSGSGTTYSGTCDALAGDAQGWCKALPNYWAQRQKDTRVLFNNHVKIGINNSYGGMIDQLYGDDRSTNLINEHGGAALQLSVWNESLHTGDQLTQDLLNYPASDQVNKIPYAFWDDENPDFLNVDYTPYKTQTECLANIKRPPGVAKKCRMGVVGPHNSDGIKEKVCALRMAGDPQNPLQAQGANCTWETTTNDVPLANQLTTATGGYSIRYDNPYNYTKSTKMNGITYHQDVELGDTYAKLNYDVENTGGINGFDKQRPQELPAFFTSKNVNNEYYFYNGSSPYTDPNSAVHVITGTGTRSIAFPNYKLPYPIDNNLKATEKWWGVCDITKTHCITVAVFDDVIQMAALDSHDNGGYITPFGRFGLSPDKLHTKFTVYAFPYKWDKVINGKSIRQRIFELAPPTPTTSNPIGTFESISSTGIASGWSLDKDNASLSNTVHLYLDGPAGTGTFIGSTTANLPRSDINNLGYPGNHGFNFTIPTQYKDGKQHTLYAYGINLTNTAGNNTLLTGSPKSFNIILPSPTCTRSYAVSSTAVQPPSVLQSQRYVDVFAAGIQNATSVKFPTWSNYNGQDDIVWYDGFNQGNGLWKATVDVTRHSLGSSGVGLINSHVYLGNSSYPTVFCGTANFNVTIPATPTATKIPPTPTATKVPTPTATKIPTVSPTKAFTPSPTIISHRADGDLNGDNKVNILDLSELATNWGKTYLTSVPLAQRYGDVNGDYKVDILDLSKIATNWGIIW